MIENGYWRRSAALIALATGLVAASGAAAQTANDAQAADDVVVTGTRIRRPDLTSNSPLTSVDAQELTLQGTNNIENALNRLPQFTADANENVSNGSNGTAQVNLRNLGSNRVLTLVNGQRLLPTQAMDLNFIPSAIVERVDIVTGGASAVYGSDALSGVVTSSCATSSTASAWMRRRASPTTPMTMAFCAGSCRVAAIRPRRRTFSTAASRTSTPRLARRCSTGG